MSQPRDNAPPDGESGDSPAASDGQARLFRLLADNAREMVSRHAPDLTFLYASPASERVIGFPPDALLGHRLDDLAHPEDLSSVISTFALARDTDQAPSTEFRCRTPGRDWRWCEIYCRGAENPDTGSEEIHATIRDISRYKQIEKAIERVAREWRETFDSAHHSIMMLDRNATILRVNRSTLRLLDCEFQDLIGRPLRDVTQERLDLDDPFDVGKIRAERKQVRSDVELPGRSTWLRSTVDPVLGEDGSIEGAVVIITDITSEKNAEFRLVRTLEEVRELSSHLQIVREEERRSVAREVHDELGHALTALKMDIAWLVKQIPTEDEKLASRGAELTALVDRTISSMRRIVSRLRPPVLDDLGLDAALEWLANDYHRYGDIDTELQLSDLPDRLRGERASGIFRIVQEALTNVSKHAEAGKVSIHGRKDGAAYRLTITDDGRGFDHDSANPPSGFGLLGIGERVRELGGSLEIDTAPGRGTRLDITLPAEVLR